MSTSMDQLPEIDPFSPEYQRDPIAAIERVRASSPLARSARGFEVLTYEGCAEVYANEHFVSATPLIAASMGLDFSALKGPGRTLTNSEGEDHTALRRIVSAWFTPRRVRELRPAVVDLVKQRIAPITARGGGDFADEVAYRIPALVFCWMMGAPTARADELFELSNTLLEFFLGDPSNSEGIKAASRQMQAFVDELIQAKRAQPGEDFISMLISAEEEGDKLSLNELLSTCVLLLVAGHETTTRLLGSTVLLLLQNPEQLVKARSDEKCLENAI